MVIKKYAAKQLGFHFAFLKLIALKYEITVL